MKFAYYPGCTTESTAREYDKSIREMSRYVGVELVEIPDWNCCGASSGHIISKELALALTSRNLGLAEKMSLDIITPCPACLLRHNFTRHEFTNSPQLKASIEADINMKIGMNRKTRHILDIFYNDVGIDNIKKMVSHSLMGLRVVCYYGCYLVRPSVITGFDDIENPIVMDKIMEALGAEVTDWAGKVDCCGGGTSITIPKIHKKLVDKIITYALQAKADAIVVACPLCQANLDMYQPKGNKALSVFYFSELTAFALGSTHVKEWLSRHMINTSSVLDRIGIL